MVMGVGLLLLAAAGAQATGQAPERAPLAELEGCRSIADDAGRLACLDRAAAALLSASKSGDVTVVDRSQLRQARRSLFGFSLPRLPFLQGDRSSEDDTGTLETTVRSVRSLGYGKVQVVVAEGNATWETTETYSTFDAPSAGQKVTIRRGPLGSYMIRFEGQRAVKGRRVG
jgi:hypothetical protein